MKVNPHAFTKENAAQPWKLLPSKMNLNHLSLASWDTWSREINLSPCIFLSYNPSSTWSKLLFIPSFLSYEPTSYYFYRFHPFFRGAYDQIGDEGQFRRVNVPWETTKGRMKNSFPFFILPKGSLFPFFQNYLNAASVDTFVEPQKFNQNHRYRIERMGARPIKGCNRSHSFSCCVIGGDWSLNRFGYEFSLYLYTNCSVFVCSIIYMYMLVLTLRF